MATAVVKRRVRLTTPLIRENGKLVAASWEQAFQRAHDLLKPIMDTAGGDGLAVFSCSKSTNELNYLASKFTRSVFVSNNVDSCNRT